MRTVMAVRSERKFTFPILGILCITLSGGCGHFLGLSK